MDIESYGLSDIGLQRHNNEDAWIEIPSLRLYVLADGMGGHQAGEIAAHETVESLVKMLSHILKSKTPLSNDELVLELKESIHETNSWVHHLSQEHPEMHGMGTTLCCLVLNQDTVIYAHVGDSRIYRFRDKLELLTRDHSLRREMAERYHLNEKASGLPSKNVITRAIGTTYHVEPDVNTTPAQAGDVYFLCSDGLTDVVDEDEIEEIIQTAPNIKSACEALVAAALAHGGQDNITLIMLKLH